MLDSDRLVLPRSFVLIDCLLVGGALGWAMCSAAHVQFTANLAEILATRFTLENLLRAAEVFLFWAILMRWFGVYRLTNLSPLSEALRITGAVLAAALVLDQSFNRHHSGSSPLNIATDFAVFCFISLYGLRAIVSLLSLHSPSGLRGRLSVLIVGTGPTAVTAFRRLRTELHHTHSLLGFVDCLDQRLCPSEIEDLYLGHVSNLESILFEQVVDEVIVALPARTCYAEIERVIETCARVGVSVQFTEDLLPAPAIGAGSHKAWNRGKTLVLRPAVHDTRLLVKRFADVCISSLLLLCLFPLLVAIAAMVKSSSEGPVFFFQERYGLGRRRFWICKFRTMQADAEAKLKELESLNEASGAAFKMRADPRITRLGALLRRTSLDELPQLLNVLKGEMSLVGPRPMSVRDVSLFSEAWLMRRFSVKPGITGLWQVSGRCSTTFKRWMELDLHYVDHWSLALDAKILALTIPAVIKGSGAM